jgi:hypothetical protein
VPDCVYSSYDFVLIPIVPSKVSFLPIAIARNLLFPYNYLLGVYLLVLPTLKDIDYVDVHRFRIIRSIIASSTGNPRGLNVSS